MPSMNIAPGTILLDSNEITIFNETISITAADIRDMNFQLIGWESEVFVCGVQEILYTLC